MATMSDLSNPEVTILIYLCAFANAKTGQCNPSQATLADRARLTRRATINVLNRLEEKGYISRTRNFRQDGSATSCSYIINIEKLPARHIASVALGVNADHEDGNDVHTDGNDVHAPCEPHSRSVGTTFTHPVIDVHTNQLLEPGIEPGIEPEEQRGAIAPAPTKVGDVAKAKKPKFDPKTMTAPDALNAGAWSEWVDYRVDKRKPITQVSAQKQVAMLAGYSFETQQQMVDASIANGWQGLFPPKVNGNQLSAAAKAQRDIDMMEGGRLLAEAAMRRALKRKNG